MYHREIVEDKMGTRTCYKVYDVFDNHRELVKTVMYQIHTKKINGVTYFLIYDYDMKPDEDAFKYINLYHRNIQKSDNTRKKIANSLTVFMAFCELFSLKPNKMDERDVSSFESFLLGRSATSYGLTVVLSSGRSAQTVTLIMNNINAFMKYKRFKNHELFKVSRILRSAVKKYKQELPKFITPEEFEQIIGCIHKSTKSEEHKLKMECMYRLMYEYGLRVGEVLGLTFEDIIPPSEMTKNACIIIIRNRLSDSSCQKAKTCMNIISKDDYFSPDYMQSKGYGYQTVVIDNELLNMISEYINMSEERMESYPSFDKCRADSVTSKFENNRYIFLNDNSASCQNYVMLKNETREIFRECGIGTDLDVRTSNLLHRFRHGFVMKLLYIDKIPANEVIKYTRHASVESLAPYDNPTDEYLIEQLMRFNKRFNKD